VFVSKFGKKGYFYTLLVLAVPVFFLAIPAKKKSVSPNVQDSNRVIQELVSGYEHYKDTEFALHEKEFLASIKNGQKPGALVITCSDSRIVLGSLFHADPGELFVVRNVGNIVPSYVAKKPSSNTSVIAAVEYAVNVLGIKDIIVMGHSHCGAVKAIYDNANLKGMNGLKAWLDTDQTVYKRAKELIAEKNYSANQGVEVLEKFNIIAQIGHLKSYDFVSKAVQDGSIFIHGWYYQFEDAAVSYYDPQTRGFKPLSEIDAK
jgi:carbonic anhydrase